LKGCFVFLGTATEAVKMLVLRSAFEFSLAV